MSRLIVPPRRSTSGTDLRESAPGTAQAEVAGDNVLDKVVKFIPSEILAAYLVLDRAVYADAKTLGKQLTDTAEAAKPVWTTPQYIDYYLPHGIFVTLLILTPVYFWLYTLSTDPKAPWRRQAVVAMIAFAVWAYAVQGGVFLVSNMFNAKYSIILLMLFTLISGFLPAEESKDAGDTDTASDRGASSAKYNAQSLAQSAEGKQSLIIPPAERTSATLEQAVGRL